jgi:hypothetical protein
MSFDLSVLGGKQSYRISLVRLLHTTRLKFQWSFTPAEF